MLIAASFSIAQTTVKSKENSEKNDESKEMMVIRIKFDNKDQN